MEGIVFSIFQLIAGVHSYRSHLNPRRMAALSQSPAAQLALPINARQRQPTGSRTSGSPYLGTRPRPDQSIKTRHRPPQAVRPLRRHNRSPLHLRVFDHLRLIARTNRPPAAFERNHIPADGGMIRSACEVDDLPLRIIQGFGITRDSTTGNVQEFRQSLRIRQEPSLHRAHGEPKAHTGCGVRQPLPAQDWRAILGWLERLVPIEIDEHEPPRTTRSVVVSTDIAFQAILPPLDIYPVDAGTGLVDELSHHEFVRLPFHCRRDEYRARRVHVSPNKASRYVPSGWVQWITMSPSGIQPSNRSRIS